MTSLSDPTKKYIVFVFGWDLFPLSDVKGMVAGATKLPKQYLHVGIGVYNRLYHFTTNGIHENYSMPDKYKILHDEDSENLYGLTTKTQVEFKTWCDNQNRETFGIDSYNTNNNNCICFARAACQFLEVDFAGPQIMLQNWLESSTLANPIIENLRTNAVFQFLSSSTTKLFGSKSAELDVEKTIFKVFNVDAAMAKLYQLSNSGGVYRKEDASIME
ncbi:uncharacterized protein LOC119072665 isoform X2 [Bradysia coprophila]|uniref:uncharacterized protein LOC119072665 isoform X2 n=1 Tax=Bradysia coprophila TaxID=38358 RepID=UPI00187DBC3C|nr:uncharacterized protein LOC119072665 isoform X2 [Bradysia coprophila]